jgi:hypothetical protein
MACSITPYTILKDFSLPLVALIWAVYSWYQDNRRVLSIRQVGDAYSERVADTSTGITTFSVEVVVTNDSPRANIVIAYYDLELPWKDDDFDPLFDPGELDPPSEFYKIHPESIQVERDKVLNHRRYQNGKLEPGEAFRGHFLKRRESDSRGSSENGTRGGSFYRTGHEGQRIPFRADVSASPLNWKRAVLITRQSPSFFPPCPVLPALVLTLLSCAWPSLSCGCGLCPPAQSGMQCRCQVRLL